MKLTHTRIRRFLILAAAGLLVLGVCVVAVEARRQRELLEIAHRSHGEIAWTPVLHDWPGWVRSLEPFPFIHAPRQIILSAGSSRNDVERFFDILANSSNLSRRIEDLYLWDSSTTTADLQRLPELPSLTFLELDRTPVDDDCITVLARFPALQTLSLCGTDIGDRAMARMPPLPQLYSLDLSGTRVTEAGLRPLTGLPSLKFIDLRLTPAVMNRWPDSRNPYAPVELPWLEARIPSVITESSFFIIGGRESKIRMSMESARAGGDPEGAAKFRELIESVDTP